MQFILYSKLIFISELETTNVKTENLQMKVLGEKEDARFVLHTDFKSEFLLPIGQYVNWKLLNNWDDYNELYHAVQFLVTIRDIDGVWFETHTIEKDEAIRGVIIMVGGKVKQVEPYCDLEEKYTLLLKYFHIVDKGRGLGTYWLNSIIKPHYADKGFRHILVSSSHLQSFNFYEKMGKEVRTFTKHSDNGLFIRLCKSFLISI